MDTLRLAVLGSPEVFHDERRLSFGLRKAQALLLYLAVEGGMHPRGKLAAFLWPDSEPHDARTALRNVLALLRGLLDAASPAAHSHLLIERELIGLDPHVPLEFDLDVVQQAYTQAQVFATLSPEPQRSTLLTQWHHALSLVRGPFLDGFWLGKDAPFDEWVQQQQQQWQVRQQLLLDRLSSWHEAAGEWEQAIAILSRWLALEPLQEEAYRRLMRLYLTQGDPTAAWQVYATCRTRLAQELQIEPSADTVALAARIRATAAASRRNSPARPSSVSTPESRPSGELAAPLVGRASAFSQLGESFQQAQLGQPQAVLLVGEAGMGKTRLAREFVAWAQAQGADVLRGHALEMGGRLPYQPLVEALRPRLEAENAPEDLLEDLWLAELSRLLPELRVRYPDLPTPPNDELTARVRLFEAVARLLDALAQRRPLVLLLDDLHWLDGASLDLLRYLGHSWKEDDSRVLLLGTMRREGLEPKSQIAVQLTDLGRDLPVRQVPLQALSQQETRQLLEAIVGKEKQSMRRRGKQDEHGSVRPSSAGPGAPPSSELERSLVRLGDFLFAQTGGHPLYLLETLKLLRERGLLVPRLDVDGAWKLEPSEGMVAAVAQEQSRRELLPPSVRAMILTRLAKLSPAAQQLVRAAAVLGHTASAQLLWQVAELSSLPSGQGTQTGVEALEEAISSGILREEGAGVGQPSSYHFAYDLVRDVVYTELGEARRLVLHQHARVALHLAGAPAAEAASRWSMGDEALAVFAALDGIGHSQEACAFVA